MAFLLCFQNITIPHFHRLDVVYSLNVCFAYKVTDYNVCVEKNCFIEMREIIISIFPVYYEKSYAETEFASSRHVALRMELVCFRVIFFTFCDEMVIFCRTLYNFCRTLYKFQHIKYL